VEQLPDQGKEEINKINRDLVAKLKLTDSAFSLGKLVYATSWIITYGQMNFHLIFQSFAVTFLV